MQSTLPRTRPQVALIAMPWYSVWVPSVQLAVLRQCLNDVADVASYELYVDYAAMISPHLYDPLSGGSEFVEEWVFAQSFFRGEGIPYEEDMERLEFPPLGIGSPEKERQVLEALAEVTDDFLVKMRDAYDWGRYDVIGFTLGIAQTSASMALAALIRRKFPSVRIIFGGSACLGPQAEAMMRICPYVDAIVQGEAEGIVEELVTRLANGAPLGDMRGLIYRSEKGEIVSTGERAERFDMRRPRILPQFDEYFARMTRNGLRDDRKIMLPFESSRGCWWGERSQCTFCGLAEDMRYRSRDAESVLEEIDSLHGRYGVKQFFATDLIMPVQYYRDFLPAIRVSERDYKFYYELKANVRREHVALLSGLVHVQPGLESLSSRVLKIMKKGITAAQNVQFLKWCREYGVQIFSWHLIVGMPFETERDLAMMTARAPLLHHLAPPQFAYFELHRFSPIHRNPAAFGLSELRPARLYKKVFPVPDSVLEQLVYRFEYKSQSFDGNLPLWMEAATCNDYGSKLRDAVDTWREAFERGAEFSSRMEGGTTLLRDTRQSEEPVIHHLSGEQSLLFHFLDTYRRLEHLPEQFRKKHPRSSEALGGDAGILRWVKEFQERGWVFEEDGMVVALAVPATPRPVIELSQVAGREAHSSSPAMAGKFV